MRRTLLTAALAALAALAAACAEDRSLPADNSGGTGTSALDGLPCDVAEVLTAKCLLCHGAGTSFPLNTWDALAAKSSVDPAKTRAQAAAAMMAGTLYPQMPPTGTLTSAEVATVQNWVTAGAAKGTCDAGGTGGGTGTGGTSAGAPPDKGNVCSSGQYSTATEGPSMKPGQACIACHTANGQRTWSAMGTVFPSLHEPNDCEGSNGVIVELTGANGQVVTGTTNRAGNFLFNATSLTKPWSVKVKANGLERAMGGTITTGDCNSCHTQVGSSGAPGRIASP